MNSFIFYGRVVVVEDLTDKEQIEMIKQWWRNHGKGIVFAVVLGLAIGFGWRYWRSHNIEKAERASVVYQQVQVAAAQQQFDVVASLAPQLMKDYRSTPYASMAALLWARDAVLQNNLKLAVEKLQWVIDNSKMSSAKQIARIRAARILLAQKQYDSAMNLLATVDDAAYQPLTDSVKGDIYRAMGKETLAKQSFQAAQNGFQSGGIVDPFLNMKIAR